MVFVRQLLFGGGLCIVAFVLIFFIVPHVTFAAKEYTYTPFFCRYFNVILIPLGGCVVDIAVQEKVPVSKSQEQTESSMTVQRLNSNAGTQTRTVSSPSIVNSYVTYQTNASLSDEELYNRIRKFLPSVEYSAFNQTEMQKFLELSREFTLKQADRIYDSTADRIKNLTEDGSFLNPQLTGSVNFSDLNSSSLVYLDGNKNLASLEGFFTSSNSLAIGTTTAHEKLTVVSPIYLGESSPFTTTNRLYNQNGSLYWNGSILAGAAVGNWDSNGTDVFRLTGKVGIGTSSPGAMIGTPKLGVMGNDGEDVKIYVQSQGLAPATVGVANTLGSLLSMATFPVGYAGTESGISRDNLSRILSNATNFLIHNSVGNIVFSTAGIERMRIASSGNIGIGTTTPEYALDLGVRDGVLIPNDKVIRATTMLIERSVNNAFSGSFLSRKSRLGGILNDDDQFLAIIGQPWDGTTWNSSTQINFSIDGTPQVGVRAPSKISFINTTAAGAQFTSMTMRASGNIGVGSTSPLAKFTVTNNTANTSFIVEDQDNDPTPFIIDATGNVGIGTSTPTAKLDVFGDIVVSGSNTGKIVFKNASSTDWASIATLNGGLALSGRADAAGTPDLFITNGGNTGIGTTSPSEFLTVSGSSASGRTVKFMQTASSVSSGAYTFEIDSSAHNSNLTSAGAMAVNVNSGRAFTINGFGNIGIGTTTPSAQLTTTGTVRFATFGAGTLQTDASGNLSVSSDERLKDIQGTYQAGLPEVLGLEPILYKWNRSSGLETASVYAGFSAQNVRDFLPEAVGEDKRGYLTLSDRGILAAVVNSISELWDTISTIKSDVSDLKVENDQIKAENASLRARLDVLEVNETADNTSPANQVIDNTVEASHFDEISDEIPVTTDETIANQLTSPVTEIVPVEND